MRIRHTRRDQLTTWLLLYIILAKRSTTVRIYAHNVNHTYTKTAHSQVVENYKMGSADCLSLNFLSIWLAGKIYYKITQESKILNLSIGDTANLIGAILTHQLPFQLYLGIYFVSIDICLLSQWIYYSKIKKSPHHDEYLIIPSNTQDEEEDEQKKPTNRLFQHPAASQQTPLDIHNSTAAAIHNELTPFSSSASPSKWYTLDNEIVVVGGKKTNNHNTARFMGMLLFTTTLFMNSSSDDLTTMGASSVDDSSSLFNFEFTQDNVVWIGRVFAWTCTCLYLMSRIPQLLKNRRRQSVEGLSASLFAFAVCGNLTYASSILSHPGQTIDSLIEALPYLIGSAGTLIFDFSIFCQFLYYKNRKVTHSNKFSNDQVV